MEKKGRKLSILILGLGLLIISFGEVFGQLDCFRPAPNTLNSPSQEEIPGIPWSRGYPTNVWNAHVFQLSPDYNPRLDGNATAPKEFKVSANGGIPRQYKGYLVRDDNLFLPSSGLNFDTQFNDINGNTSTDDNYFKTGNAQIDLAFAGCEVQLKHFGVLMRSRTKIETTGIYKISVGSDDGSYLNVWKTAPGTAPIQDINGNPLIHNNWFKDPADPNWDGYYNYIYDQNIRNYYVEFTKDEEVFFQLSYYEKTGGSRLSFSLELYLGPGEIRLGTNQTGVHTYCGINPNVPAFTSWAGGVFENGPVSDYQWQYATIPVGVGANWTDIIGAKAAVYDLPAHNLAPWEGTRYYRRAAIDQITKEDNDGNIISTTIKAYTNVIQINMSTIADIGQNEYGKNSWIGHIYSGLGSFTASNYRGRYYEDKISFNQIFRAPGAFPGEANQVNFIPDHGCPILPTQFSVRYMMEYAALPGEYTVRVMGDDRFRMSVRDANNNILGGSAWLMNQWTNGPLKTETKTFEVEEEGPIYFVLEYYEHTGDQRISFEITSIKLPVEWGQVSGNACGENNCLTWETLQEKNTSHFTVERSYDGSEWTPLGEQVEAQGFSTESTSYQFTDATFMRERSFYRVKQVDLDGSMDYSETIRIDNHSFRNKMLPYPNPTVDRVRFFSAEEVLMIQVTSHDSRVNTRVDFAQVDQNIYELDFSQMQNSHYVITVVTKDSRKSHKIIKK